MTKSELRQLLKVMVEKNIPCYGIVHFQSNRCVETGKHYGCDWDVELDPPRSGGGAAGS